MGRGNLILELQENTSEAKFFFFFPNIVSLFFSGAARH